MSDSDGFLCGIVAGFYFGIILLVLAFLMVSATTWAGCKLGTRATGCERYEHHLVAGKEAQGD